MMVPPEWFDSNDTYRTLRWRNVKPRAVSSPRLTETSYIVLGLLEQTGPATPYDLKRLAQISTINFWSSRTRSCTPSAPGCAGEGLLDERREQTGRRRRIYRLTERGRQALESWRVGADGGEL